MNIHAVYTLITSGCPSVRDVKPYSIKAVRL